MNDTLHSPQEIFLEGWGGPPGENLGKGPEEGTITGGDALAHHCTEAEVSQSGLQTTSTGAKETEPAFHTCQLLGVQLHGRTIISQVRASFILSYFLGFLLWLQC